MVIDNNDNPKATQNNEISTLDMEHQVSPSSMISNPKSPPYKKPNNNNSPSSLSTNSDISSCAFQSNTEDSNITKASIDFATILAKAHSVYNSPAKKDKEVPITSQQISSRVLDNIEDGEYITDTIINFWSEWIKNNYPSATNCHFCSSFLFSKLQDEGYESVKNWDKNIVIKDKEVIFIPINNVARFHWYLAIIVPGKFITIFDSLQSSNSKEETEKVTSLLYKWLNGRGIQANKENLPLKSARKIPQQINGYDCGIYVCKFIQCVLAQLQLNGHINSIEEKYFNIIPSDITSLRQCIKEKLLYSKSEQNKHASSDHSSITNYSTEAKEGEKNKTGKNNIINASTDNKHEEDAVTINMTIPNVESVEQLTPMAKLPQSPEDKKKEDKTQQSKAVVNSPQEDEESEASGHSDATRSTKISINRLENRNRIPTEEDDFNTTASGETTTYRRSEMNVERPPDSFRYRLIIPMPKIPAAAVARQQNGENLAPHESDTFLRLREALVKFYNHIRSIDNTLFIMKWSSKVVEKVETPDLLPTDPVLLSEYFEGYNPKTEEGKRQFLRVRISSAGNKKNVIAAGKAFAAPHGGSFNILSVNVEQSTEIGYLIYSSRYTDTDHLCKFLEKKTKFPWGFAYKQLHSNNPEPDWRKRVRVQTIHVPSEKKELAIATLQDIFKITQMEQPEFPEFTQKYLYAAAEHEHDQFPDEESIRNQMVMMQRHRIHFHALEAKFTTSITGSLDRMINTRTGKKASLRQLILSIKSTREGPLKGTPLFHAVDFIADSKEVTFQKNQKGSGGPGHIFSYYKTNRSEAVAMVRGLGVFIGKIFGKKATYKYFNADHWKTNNGWRWSVSEKKFITREALQIKHNVQFDYNAAVLLLQNDNLEEPIEKENSISSTTNYNSFNERKKVSVQECKEQSDRKNITDTLVTEDRHKHPEPEEGEENLLGTAQADHQVGNVRETITEERTDRTSPDTSKRAVSNDEESEESTVLDIQNQLQVDLLQAQIDPDAQSLGHEDDRDNPTAINVTDNDSTTSSLTWNRSLKSNEDDTSTIASRSMASVSTASAATAPSNDTSLKSITNIKHMEDMYDQELTEEENMRNYENYIAANTKKAQEIARRNYASMCKAKSSQSNLENKLSIPISATTTSTTNDDKSDKSTSSSVEIENLVSTPIENQEHPVNQTGSKLATEDSRGTTSPTGSVAGMSL